jgi:hypothetical protein
VRGLLLVDGPGVRGGAFEFELEVWYGVLLSNICDCGVVCLYVYYWRLEIGN